MVCDCAMNKFFDVRTPFMKPLWRRIAFAGFTLGWGTLEMISGSAGFGLLFLAAGVFLVHQFFIGFKPEEWDAPVEDAQQGAVPTDEPPSAAQNAGDVGANIGGDE